MACELKAPPFLVPEALDTRAFLELRRRAVLEHSKWDPQVGDVSTLSAFPLLIPPSVWKELAALSEELTAEAMVAERELFERPELHRRLGISRALRRVLSRPEHLEPTRGAARVLRYDFHWTREGWRISEANSDVPGGFSEASSFTEMMAEHYPEAMPAGNPAARWAEAIARAAGPRGVIALLSAPGYMEDFQVVSYMAARLRDLGRSAHLAGPSQVCWERGQAHVRRMGYSGRVDAVVRFYQGEWLPCLPRWTGWPGFFCAGETPTANPGIALLVESKRFPLVWDELRAPLPAWRRLFPETRDPADAPWPRDEGWLIKSAFSNNGDSVTVRGITEEEEWRKNLRAARRHPDQWLAQRRFEAIGVPTPAGTMYPCLGIYTIDGRAAGIYGRMAPRPLIDFSATDVPVLVLQ
jgi:hypothetical protein